MANHVLSLCVLFCLQYSLQEQFHTVSVLTAITMNQLGVGIAVQCIAHVHVHALYWMWCGPVVSHTVESS